MSKYAVFNNYGLQYKDMDSFSEAVAFAREHKLNVWSHVMKMVLYDGLYDEFVFEGDWQCMKSDRSYANMLLSA